ncbi:MAG: RagB/SusD family nutrient uptake outer membrane protein [Prevotellaceae bacterium]|nr:RagB/SusD family nutrient uptake outer membrane protein [Prevotellaceae bacterium]
MKTIKKYFVGAVLFATAMGGFTSCGNLDENPYTFIDPSSYYKTEAEVNSALNTVYNRFRNLFRDNNQMFLANLELFTEQGWPTYPKNGMNALTYWHDINNASYSDLGVYKTWAANYVVINDANIVIARADGVDMSKDAKDQIKGQAYFLRAYSFYYLLRLFGGVPLPTDYTKGVTGLEMPRATVDETYERIIEDLTTAESLLPVRGTKGYDVWRASKGAAQALLGEVYLYRASMNGNNTEYLKKAMEYSKAVIDSKVYSLMPEFTDQYYWFNQAGAKNNQESLFELQFSPENGQDNGMHIRFGLGRTYNNYMGCYQYARMGVSAFLNKEMVDNGDKRANAFLTYFEDDKGNKYQFDAATYKWVCTNDPSLTVTNDKSMELRCPFNCKYFDQHTDFSLQHPCANFPMLRYAEVLLNYAEASNLLGGSDAVTYLNMIRNRAGLANFSGSGKDAIDEEIFQQRRYEFVGEGKIYFDELRRNVIGQYNEDKCKNGVAMGMPYFEQQLEFKAGRSFLFKIPQTDLDGNSALVQNPDNVAGK